MIDPSPSPITQRAAGFAAERRNAAEVLGRSLADEVGEPDRFAVVLDNGLAALADPGYLAGQRHVAPGIGDLHGVSWPLLDAVKRGFREATRRERTSGWLFVADRLLREPKLEAHWFAFGLLERLVVDDTERAWQLIRRASHQAADWITVDSLAHPVGKGVLAEAYRWAELELLVYSPSRWERRLVGSTIATIPFIDRRLGRDRDVAIRGLGLLRQLIGDREPDVQKALAWAVRSMAGVDLVATTAFLDDEALQAATGVDGHRAWVIRDSLPKLDPVDADRIRKLLGGIRRHAADPSTSRAADTALRFRAGLPGGPVAEAPLA